MAVFSVVALDELAAGDVLAPERYHPGRRARGGGEAVALGALCTVESELVAPGPGEARLTVLDTGDVSEGFVRGAARSCARAELGSTKKRARPGDVLVSRLRPYLRQIALVDEAPAPLCCSTEFFVLRARGAESIAFLVPYLLSAEPQAILQASVEGGHHPRFRREALEELPVPRRLVRRRRSLSRAVEAALAERRAGERALARLIRDAGR
ncbi:MAG TPA: hypothetical protein VFF06_03065 [Polyangia bacterium]|nr:hypothetical protein [Polyangia bacterium]